LEFLHLQRATPATKGYFSPPSDTEKAFHFAMEHVRNRLMPVKGKTDVMDDEGNELITQDTHTTQDVDDLLTSIGTRGLDVLEEPRTAFAALEPGKESDEVELDLRTFGQ